MTETSPTHVEQSGVKGMRWGVHRTEAALARAGHRSVDFAKTPKGKAFIGSALAVGGTAALYGVAPQTFVAGGAAIGRIFEAQHHENVRLTDVKITDLHKFGHAPVYNYGSGG